MTKVKCKVTQCKEGNRCAATHSDANWLKVKQNSVVNKDLTFKAKAKAKDLTFKAKAKAKDNNTETKSQSYLPKAQ